MEIQKPGDSKGVYQKEYKQGVEVFEKSFKGIETTKKFPQKKMEFEKSGNESLQAIEDAAKALMNKELLQLKEKLAKDYNAYLQDPTAANQEKVEQDIDSMKSAS